MRAPLLRAVGWRLLAVGLLVGLAVTLQAGAPQDADDTAWRLDDLLERGREPLVVLAVVWLAVVLIVVVLGLREREGRPAGPRRRRSSLASLGLFAFFVLLAWLLQQARDGRRAGPLLPESTPRPTPPPAVPGDASMQNDPGVVLLVVLALVAVLAIVLVVRTRRPLAVLTEDDLPALAEGLEAAGRVLRRRSDEEPRERVVSAYEAFEAALAARGVERGRSGTPTALLASAVVAGAPEQPAAELTRLFGLARFGIEPVTQDHVRAAEQAVDAMLASR